MEDARPMNLQLAESVVHTICTMHIAPLLLFFFVDYILIKSFIRFIIKGFCELIFKLINQTLDFRSRLLLISFFLFSVRDLRFDSHKSYWFHFDFDVDFI